MNIRRLVKKCLLYLSTAFVLAIGGDMAVRQLVQKSTPLPQDQIDRARTVFGDQIDYSKVRIMEGPISFLQDAEKYKTVFNTIYVPRECSVRDLLQSHIVNHELTHVQQQKKSILKTLANVFNIWCTHKDYKDAYFYTADSTKKLSEYNIEQQGDIVEDYLATEDALKEAYNKSLNSGDTRLFQYTINDEEKYAVLGKIIASELPLQPDKTIDSLATEIRRREKTRIALQAQADIKHIYEHAILAAIRCGKETTEIDTSRALHFERHSLDLPEINVVYSVAYMAGFSRGISSVEIRQKGETVFEAREGTVHIYKPGEWEKKLFEISSDSKNPLYHLPKVSVPVR